MLIRHQEWERVAGTQPLPATIANATKEYLCIQAYLNAQNAFTSWFHHHQGLKPIPPSPLRGANPSYSEEVAHEMAVKRFENEQIRWRKTGAAHTEVR